MPLRGSGLLLAGSVGAIGGSHARQECLLAEVVAVVDEGRRLTKGGPRLPPLTAEGVVGGTLSVLHTHLSRVEDDPAEELLGPLMSIIVLPYLGPMAAQSEFRRPAQKTMVPPPSLERKWLSVLGMRLTYRTIRVLAAVAKHPGSSNREIAPEADVADEGQMSRLLARLQSLGLIENAGPGALRGEPNSWTLSEQGWQVHEALGPRAAAN